jgi:hypothetical protein
MIGSLMSRMGMAEKLSVAQLQKAVQDGTLPAYVGVPLIQDKLKQEQMAKAATSGAQQQQPPIAQQVMQAAEQRGIDEAQSNLPEASMAGGGIVAFAGGGMYDDDDETDDDEDTLEERQQAAEMQSLFNAAAGRMAEGAESDQGIGSLAAAAPTAKESREIAYSINPESKGGFGIKDMLAAKAAENKLPPELLNKIAGIESGYKSTAANPNSSAKGLFQFTDATWKGMGGREGEQFNPEKNAELGAKFVRQNAEGLKNALGRNPTYGEVYASHFFGLKGAKDLLNMDPKTPMDQAVSAQVLKANPQLKDKTVGQVMANLNSKMGDGIVALAKGGAVKYYADPKKNPDENQLVMGDIAEGTDNPFAMMGDIGASSKDYDKKDYGIKKAIRNELMGVKTQEEVNKERFKTPPSRIPMGPTNEELGRPTAESKALEDITKELATKEEGKGIDSAAPKEPTFEQKYMELLKGREAGTAKQRSVDNYMALLQAGLGMMGGTSPYGSVNIGQGASTGIAAKMAAEKNRIAEENATMKGYGNLYSTQQNAEMRKTLAGQSQDAAMRKQQFATMGNLEQRTRASIAASLDKSMGAMGLSDDEKARKVDQLTAQALAQSQAYKSAYKAYNGYDFAVQPAVGQGPVDYTGTYGLTPKK